MTNKQREETFDKVVHPLRLSTTEKKKLGWIVVLTAANYLGAQLAISLARKLWTRIDGQQPPQPSQVTGFLANAVTGFNNR
jgi:hypothetical protein